jgi:predicted small lipoprotein YifL
MKPATRVSVGLAAFLVLAGCGQRGPLTLSESARPIQRLDSGAAKPAADSAAPSSTAPADTTPRPEDDEQRSRE